MFRRLSRLLIIAALFLMGLNQGHSLQKWLFPQGLAAALPSTSTEFFVIGDWGCGLKEQYQVANAMTAMLAKTPIKFVVTVGDNIYQHGNILKHAEDYFVKPYKAFHDKKIPFLVSLGNHDVPHQDDQTKYFKMPGAYYSFTRGNVFFAAINSNNFDAAQAAWLSKTLANSNAKWKIVFGHHPLYSSGPHGKDDTLPAFKASLKPILEKQHVDFYLCGHDHHYERFAPVNGVYYVLTGGGGASLRGLTLSDGNKLGETSRKVAHVKHHYMWFKADGNKLFARAYDINNTVLDSFYLQKK